MQPVKLAITRTSFHSFTGMRLVLGGVLDRWFAPRVTAAVAVLANLSFVLLMTAVERPT